VSNPSRSSRKVRWLSRILSKAGAGSRAQAALWIRSGRVRVNGAVVLDPEAWFDPDRDKITLDGRLVDEPKKVYFLLHKPRGYITTRSDPGERPTIYGLIEDIGEWVIPVGRLDLDTSGMLLLTNDTQFAEFVTNPASHLSKTYRVEAKPRLTDEALAELANGVILHDGPTRPARIERRGERGPRTVFDMTITEGRNRQVRRMVKAVGSRVEKLARIAIGPIPLGDLERGKYRPLTAAEVRALLRESPRPRS
jgi:23S rRNA pseudouridine2605 synthase